MAVVGILGHFRYVLRSKLQYFAFHLAQVHFLFFSHLLKVIGISLSSGWNTQ